MALLAAMRISPQFLGPPFYTSWFPFYTCMYKHPLAWLCFVNIDIKNWTELISSKKINKFALKNVPLRYHFMHTEIYADSQSSFSYSKDINASLLELHSFFVA